MCCPLNGVWSERHAFAEAPGEIGEFVVGDVEMASCRVENGGLLLVVGHPGRQGCEVPVDVPVGLLAAEGQDVKAFRGEQIGECAACAVHDRLEGEVFVGGEVGDGVLAVFDRGDEEVAEHGGEAAGEDDGVVVAVGDVVGVVGVAGKEFADEAGTAGEFEVGVGLPGRACGHQSRLPDPQRQPALR